MRKVRRARLLVRGGRGVNLFGTKLDFSADQEEALDAIELWKGNPAWVKQYLALGGYAGTGKTTIIAHLATNHFSVAVCAYCGKAAHVLRSKGVDATTIHSLIYVPFQDAQGRTRYRKRKDL